jgi:hypothetical protein
MTVSWGARTSLDTHCQGHQDPSKRVPIFLGTPEALIKMVPIGWVPIPRSRTVVSMGARTYPEAYFAENMVAVPLHMLPY